VEAAQIPFPYLGIGDMIRSHRAIVVLATLVFCTTIVLVILSPEPVSEWPHPLWTSGGAQALTPVQDRRILIVAVSLSLYIALMVALFTVARLPDALIPVLVASLGLVGNAFYFAGSASRTTQVDRALLHFGCGILLYAAIVACVVALRLREIDDG